MQTMEGQTCHYRLLRFITLQASKGYYGNLKMPEVAKFRVELLFRPTFDINDRKLGHFGEKMVFSVYP